MFGLGKGEPFGMVPLCLPACASQFIRDPCSGTFSNRPQNSVLLAEAQTGSRGESVIWHTWQSLAFISIKHRINTQDSCSVSTQNEIIHPGQSITAQEHFRTVKWLIPGQHYKMYLKNKKFFKNPTQIRSQISKYFVLECSVIQPLAPNVAVIKLMTWHKTFGLKGQRRQLDKK